MDNKEESSAIRRRRLGAVRANYLFEQMRLAADGVASGAATQTEMAIQMTELGDRELPPSDRAEKSDEPDLSIYLQSDGQFVSVEHADDSAIPYSIAHPEAQARWPRI